ncbi:MAG: ECF-type sigma factor [Gemmatimonadota bacterium]|nr:ECF-type sigma factor [Gemmatimonadota bacterium]
MPTESPMPSRAAEDEREIADALAALGRGAPQAMQRLIPRVYEELRRIAHRQLAVERGDHTLSTTAVVHEAYLRLVEQHDAAWNDRAHFFSLAAGVMRRVLTDYARRHKAVRRGGPAASRVALDDADAAGVLVASERAAELLALDEALIRLGRVDARMSKIVECRVYGGLSAAETATALGTSLRTVEREWALAKGWLYQELRDDAG